MKTYQDIKSKIAALEKEAETLLQRELSAVVAQLKKTIAQYNLTAADLGLTRGAAPARSKRGATAKAGKFTVGAAKYRDPASQKTWTGRGKPPNWIRGVADRNAFLIDAPTAAPAPEAAKPARKTAKPVKAAKTVKAVKATKAPKAKAKRGRAGNAALQIEGGVAAQ